MELLTGTSRPVWRTNKIRWNRVKYYKVINIILRMKLSEADLLKEIHVLPMNDK